MSCYHFVDSDGRWQTAIPVAMWEPRVDIFHDRRWDESKVKIKWSSRPRTRASKIQLYNEMGMKGLFSKKLHVDLYGPPHWNRD